MKNKVDKNLLLSSNHYHYAFFKQSNIKFFCFKKIFFIFSLFFLKKKRVFEQVPGILKNRGYKKKKFLILPQTTYFIKILCEMNLIEWLEEN